MFVCLPDGMPFCKPMAFFWSLFAFFFESPFLLPRASPEASELNVGAFPSQKFFFFFRKGGLMHHKSVGWR